jgi:hypothetical protein
MEQETWYEIECSHHSEDNHWYASSDAKYDSKKQASEYMEKQRRTNGAIWRYRLVKVTVVREVEE